MEKSLKETSLFKKKKEKKFSDDDQNKNWWSKFLTMIQELGKSLQFPIAVLPFAAILNRFGALGISYTFVNGEITNQVGYWISMIIQIPGGVVFDNLALLFAIGVAFGLSKDNRGEVAMVGGLFYLVLIAMTAENTLPQMIYGNVLTFEAVNGSTWSRLFYIENILGNEIIGGVYVLNIGVLGGITAGAMSAFLYNRFKDIKLPTTLSFFGGRRFVPMIALAVSIPTAMGFAIIWPWIQLVLMLFGNQITDPSNLAVVVPGAAFYGILNRLLLPFGLHQILNTFFWFQLPITGVEVDPITGIATGGSITINGDIPAFTAGLSTSGVFQSGFFPIMMGGIPAIAVAMIFAAKKENRKEVSGFLGGVALVSLISGITEPIEFSFVFLSPLLLVIHALLTGVFYAITTLMQIQIGFGFSAGIIDYAISLPQSWGLSNYNDTVMSNPLWILTLTAAAGGVYFVVFYTIIKKMNLQTPGRELLYSESKNLTLSESKSKSSQSSKYELMAEKIIDAIKKENIVKIDNCATRLRLIVLNNLDVDDTLIKAAGTYGIKRLGTETLQIVIGPDVEHVANAMKKILK